MALYELHRNVGKSLIPDTYRYDFASNKLRTQIAMIVKRTLGEQRPYEWSLAFDTYKKMFDTLSLEYGQGTLMGHAGGSEDWYQNMLQNSNIEELLDLIKITFETLSLLAELDVFEDIKDYGATQEATESIAEINTRMKRDGFGYEFCDGVLIRIDSQYVHSESVKPALNILQYYEAPRQEFLEAHEHYRHQNFKECLMSCGRAFEGMMKIICDKEGWEYNPKKAGASNLIALCKDKGLFETHTQEHLNGLAKTLESGVPPIRNDKAGHAKAEPIKVSEHITKYTLHLTAVNLVFLSDCYEAMNE